MQISPFGELAEGAGVVTEAALTGSAIHAVNKIAGGSKGKKKRRKKKKAEA